MNTIGGNIDLISKFDVKNKNVGILGMGTMLMHQGKARILRFKVFVCIILVLDKS